MNRIALAAAILLFGTALLLALHVHRIPWVEEADFDVIGVLWLLLNLPKLMGWVFTFLLAVLGAYALGAAYGRGLPPFSRFSRKSEEERLANDPRFRPDRLE